MPEATDDYFQMLGIPVETDDFGAIDAGLSSKRKEIALKRGIPGAVGLEMTRQQGLLPEIERVLKDPSERRRHRDQVRRVREEAHRKKVEEVQQLLDIYKRPEGLTREELDALRNKAKQSGVSDGELAQMTRGIAIRSDPVVPDQPEPEIEHIDTSLYDEILRKLSVLKKTTLYDLVGKSRNAPTGELRAAIDDLRDTWRKRKVDAEKTLWENLLALASTYLLDPQKRRQYDSTPLYIEMQRFEQFVRDALKPLKHVSRETLERLAGRGTEDHGLKAPSCKSIVEKVRRALTLTIEEGPARPDARSTEERPCPHCKQSTKKDADFCQACGGHLTWVCARCHEKNGSEQARCRKCRADKPAPQGPRGTKPVAGVPNRPPPPAPGKPIRSSHSLVVRAEPDQAGSVLGGGGHSSGQRARVEARPNPTWRFAYWSGDLTGAAASAELLINGDKEIVAHFEKVPQVTLKLSVWPAEGGTVMVNTTVTKGASVAVFEKGSMVQLKPAPSAGWEFHHWEGVAPDSRGMSPLGLLLQKDLALTGYFVMKGRREGTRAAAPDQAKAGRIRADVPAWGLPVMIAGTPWVMLPVMASATDLLLFWAGVFRAPFVLFGGIVGVLVGIGMFLSRLILCRESLLQEME